MWPDYYASWLSEDQQDKNSDAFDVLFLVQLSVKIMGFIHKDPYLSTYNHFPLNLYGNCKFQVNTDCLML